MKLSCTMCQDLIPLYADKLLSSESSDAVAEHLIHCTDCQSYLDTLQQDLPQPLTTLEDTNMVLLSKLQKRLTMTQYLFLLCGMLLSSFFVLTDNIFQNILFLPLIGFTGYFFTRHLFRIPFITSLVLYLVFSFKEASYYIGTSKFLGELLSCLGFMLFWAAIFFALTTLGSAVAILLIQASKDFKHRSYKAKAYTIAIYSIVIVITSIVLLLYNGSNGNPITALYARARMNAYLETTYPDFDYALHEVSYNFKSGNYSADAYMYTGEAARPFSINYGTGKVYDDYYATYVEDMGTSLRLGKEAGEQIEALLTTAAIPFYTVDAYTSVPLNRYTHTPYSPTTITEPLELSIYKYTDTKESIEDFSLWCETLRSFLLTSGYPLKSITFSSDPHFMVSRLELTLKNDALSQPISLASNLSGFVDYGAINGFNDLTPTEWEKTKSLESKMDPTPNKATKKKIDTLLHSLGINTVDLDIHNYLEGADISISWNGDYQSPEAFATQCILIRDALMTHKEDLHIENFFNLNFAYYFGNFEERYQHNFIPETLAQTADDIVKGILLSKEKY